MVAERKKVKELMAEALDQLATQTVGESDTDDESKEVVILQGLTKVC